MAKRLHVAKYHITKYSSDNRMRKLYVYLLARAKFYRGHSDSLKAFKQPPKRKHQLPAPLELEAAERYVKFLQIKGNTQQSRKCIFYHHGKANSNLSDTVQHRKPVGISLKAEAQRQIMKYLYIRQYEMQTNWLALIDKVASADLTWRRILCGCSNSSSIFAQTPSILLIIFAAGTAKEICSVGCVTNHL